MWPLGASVLCATYSRIHEGVVLTSRDRRTLMDKFALLFLNLASHLNAPTVLIVDAYYASRKVLRPLLAETHHIITRLKCTAVAYYPAVQSKIRRRSRPRKYGEKVRLRDLWRARAKQFIEAPKPRPW